MAASRFVYVTYIRTTPEKLWRALIEPEFTRQYGAGTHQESDWTPGAPWKMVAPDGRICDAGEVIEIIPHKRLVLDWQNYLMPELKAEGISRVTYEIEEGKSGVKLRVTHELDVPNSKFIDSVSNGWPRILASLKSLLETGRALEGTDKWPEGF